MTDFRVGLGLDHHRLVAGPNASGHFLTLGGYQIPESELALAANSDGDVILHALCNALSTAIGGGSLGPIADPLCAAGQTDSKVYLTTFLDQITTNGYQINNLSLAVEAAQPKLEKHRSAIVDQLAHLLAIQPAQIGLAFTTGDGLTACGTGEGIAVQALVSLIKRPS